MKPNSPEESKPSAHPDSVNGRLARSLESQRNDIISEWLELVRKDPDIPTESLTLEQVRDHLPQLFDDLTDTLNRYGSEAVAEKSERDGEEHGAARWQQGFQLPEMLRELMHLRSILIHRLGRFESNNEDFGMVARLFVTTTLHGFLDRMGINATEQFLTQGLHERDRPE
ncbi:MAG: RsbRD N-terminal domain-containing protein [Verrucomicrobiales bacterium]